MPEFRRKRLESHYRGFLDGSDSGGNAVQENGPKTYVKTMSARTAAQLRSAMQTVVDKGTGSNAKIDGLTVGGKTGTAQHGVDNSGTAYAWFVSYADDGQAARWRHGTARRGRKAAQRARCRRRLVDLSS